MKLEVKLNKCDACGHEWHDYPGGFAKIRNDEDKAITPCCGSIYWTATPLVMTS